MTAVQAHPICGAQAANCMCGKPPGHVEDGDEVHVCCQWNVMREETCTGQWSGTVDGDDFRVIAWPTI